MGLTLATADAALKEDYQPAVREQLNLSSMFLQQMERGAKQVVGRRAVLSLHVSENSGIGSRAEGQPLPEAGNQGYAEERVILRKHYGRIKLTGIVIKAMRNDEGAFVRALDSETRGVVKDLKRDVNRQLFGTSDGAIVAVGAGATTTVIPFATTASRVQKRQIVKGMKVDIGTSAPYTSVGVNRKVTAITGTTSFTVDPPFSAAPSAADIVVRSGNGGTVSSTTEAQHEMTGLQTIVKDSVSLFNVDPSTEPSWASYVDTAGSNRALTDNLLASVMHNSSILSGEDLSLFITSDGVHRAYASTLTALKRFPGTIDLKGGYKALDVSAGGGSVGIVWDRDAPANTVFGLNTDHFMMNEMSDWEFMDADGSVLHYVAGEDAYEAVLFKYSELTTDQRNAHAKIEAVTEAA